MNISYRPQSRLMYQMPTLVAHNQTTTPAQKAVTLSARQLLDIELGLYLLSQLLPAAPPDTLPDLLTGQYPDELKLTPWNARQHRYLNRARLLLNHFCNRDFWRSQLERYTCGSAHRQAFVIDQEGNAFGGKSEGFSRNRLVSLRQILG